MRHELDTRYRRQNRGRLCVLCLASAATTVRAGDNAPESRPADERPANRLRAEHWFDLITVSEPQISPDGNSIVYVQTYRDIMADKTYSNLWIIHLDQKTHRPLTTGKFSESSPRWSRDSTRVAFVSDREGTPQVFVCFADTGQLMRVTNTPKAPSFPEWSPDGNFIAFRMAVPAKPAEGVKMPFKPEGAEWADPPVIIDKLRYRFDKAGYLKDEYQHVFMAPVSGGPPRSLTKGDYDDGPAVWAPDGEHLYFSAIRKPDAEWVVDDTEIHIIHRDGRFEPITSRAGPDDNPVPSPSGKLIAYTGYDEKWLAHTNTRLYVMNADGSQPRCLTEALDRSVLTPRWLDDQHLAFASEEEGTVQIYIADAQANKLKRLTQGPAQIREFSVSDNGRFAAVLTSPTVPGDIVTFAPDDMEPRQLTLVNESLLAFRELGTTEEITFKSSLDQLPLQGWIIKPPGFDPNKKYPLVLDIHGGPHAMYGVNFQFEFQTQAADDQVVLFINPRGSTGYGQEFGNSIQYKYPGDDYFDLMSAVDEVIQRGYIDEQNLFVTGGSGGGVLTCWLIGRTDRFAAAVSQFPVINWFSFLLTSDITAYCRKRWFPTDPWADAAHYMQRSPISLVGNVTTPCLLITGTDDWRTPISETEQYYQALKLQKKETRMIRVPDEPHGIRGRPSHYVAKLLHIQKWFDDHRRGGSKSSSARPAERSDVGNGK